MELHCDLDCIYLDFAKAFDRVSYHKLINKISDIGIQGTFYYGLLIFITQKAMSNVQWGMFKPLEYPKVVFLGQY